MSKQRKAVTWVFKQKYSLTHKPEWGMFITSSRLFSPQYIEASVLSRQETRFCSLFELFQIHARIGIKYMQNGFFISELSVTLTKCWVNKCCILTLGFLSLLLLSSKTCLALAHYCPNVCGGQCKTLRYFFKVEWVFPKNFIFLEDNIVIQTESLSTLQGILLVWEKRCFFF